MLEAWSDMMTALLSGSEFATSRAGFLVRSAYVCQCMQYAAESRLPEP